MFGESESESPRAGSPWDPFITDIPSPEVGGSVEASFSVSYNIFKLVPEVEHGNVEYKQKLLNPSPERFTKLVTQLKWRLLEGGGHAYYELGVADSGHLVGLSLAELESSLETLETMAKKLGASVVVVKEVEIPGRLSGGGGRGFAPKSSLADEDARFKEVIVASNPCSGDAVFKVDEEDSLRVHTSDVRRNEDACETITFRILLTRESLKHPDSLTDYDVEICTVSRCRPRFRQPSAVVPVEQERVGANKPKPRNDKCIDLEVKRFSRRGNRDEDALPSSSITAQIELKTPTPIIASSIDDIVPNIKALAFNDDGIPTSSIPHLTSPETRFVVEALVIRKLSLEEAFIDFDGFALSG